MSASGEYVAVRKREQTGASSTARIWIKELNRTIPLPVIGGGGLMTVAMIFASGMAIVRGAADLTRRNMVILAVLLESGLGIELRPDALLEEKPNGPRIRRVLYAHR